MSHRVLLLSASVGAGHLSAAAAIEGVFRQHPGVDVINQDALKLTTEAYRTLQSDGYQFFVKDNPWLVRWMYEFNDEPFKNESPLRQLFDRLNTLPLIEYIRDVRPQSIVCTHFIPAGIVAQLLAQREINASLSVVTTDYDFQGMWLSRIFNHYFVALPETKAHLLALGLSDDRVTVSGIPVNPLYGMPVDDAAVRQYYHLAPDVPILVVSAGAVGSGPIRDVIAQLMQVRQRFQAVVVCGKNADLRRTVETLTYPQSERFRVLGYSADMPNLVRVAALFVGKPGGLTASECMAAGTPMVIIEPIPGQEERNADHLLEKGAAIRCNELLTLGFKVGTILGDPERLAQMQSAARRLGRADAAHVIADTVLNDTPRPVEFSRREVKRIVRAARGKDRPQQPVSYGDIALYSDRNGAYIGTITERQLGFLQRHLVAETAGDTDYFLDHDTVELLRSQGADMDMLDMLERAVAHGPVEIRWVRL